MHARQCSPCRAFNEPIITENIRTERANEDIIAVMMWNNTFKLVLKMHGLCGVLVSKHVIAFRLVCRKIIL